MRLAKRASATVLVLLGLGLGLLLFPRPLFAYAMGHGNYRVRSDRPIDPAMASVLDDATRRLNTSELHDPHVTFDIFICNEPWRMWLYSQSFNASVGAVSDNWLTRNIYLRESDIAANRLIPPHGRLADADVRPLSYFIAHEATHVMQSRTFGRMMKFRYPKWLIEGYADFVAKGGSFDFEENRRLLQEDDPRLDYARSGLYRRYHLMVAMLIEKDGYTIRRLFANPPQEADVIRAIRERN
jgi:hypothetical protein